jgi:hypothetical protein
MKSTNRFRTTGRIAGLIFLAAITIFSMAGCKKGQLPPSVHLIMGTFSNQAAGVNALFYADLAPPRTARSAAAGQALTGRIEDGAIVFNLTGLYFSATGEFFLSAGSSILIYEIAGRVTTTGIQNTEAVVKVNSGGNWTTIRIPVSAVAEVEITREASGQSEGLPASWMGRWDFHNFVWEGYDPCDECPGDNCEGHGVPIISTLFITPFSLTVIHAHDEGMEWPLDIFEIKQITGPTVKFDIITEGMIGGDDGICGVECGTCKICLDDFGDVFGYAKIRIQQITDNHLELVVPWDYEAFQAYTDTDALERIRAYDMDNPEEEHEILKLTR